ncbi:MAG: efflux RND transporter permease subunit [Candidatus Pelagadaptatus aseana]|uniref:efflux RND transporter permease subunit n=1 Tax=Candidatus Pelagadaptatus aseana TaxID=3120508 RepID=UPI0039B1DC41
MKRLVQWFVENPIAANLLMVTILALGIFNMASLKKEVFPGVETGRVQIETPYPGAGPKEVEELVVKRIEEAIADLDGIEKIESESRINLGRVVVEAVNGYDVQRLLNNIKTRVDAISTFPVDAERPQISDLLWESEIMSIGVYGDVPEKILKQTGEQLRDDLALLPGIAKVTLQATRPDEMSIELSELALRRFGLSFQEVANAIRKASLNLPAGNIKSDSGDIQLQTRSQAYNREDFENIVIASQTDGSELLLKQVASVKDGFAERNLIARLNGHPAVFLKVSSSEQPDILKSAATIRDHLEQIAGELPPGVKAEIWSDWSIVFKGRMDLLLKNSFSGLLLVFLILMLFLRPALAAWVSVGIAVSFLGALSMLPLAGVSLTMISMFAFLMVLGIVVDDAIIVGESIYTAQQRGMQGQASAASGAKQVAKPVLFAVLSTMIFFMPLLNIPGGMGDMTYAIPVVVILALFFSLVESLLILPSHLAHLKPERPDESHPLLARLERLREKLARSMDTFASQVYEPNLARMLRHKTITIIGFGLAFGLSVALFTGGWIQRTFMPQVPSDFIQMRIDMPEGIAFGEMEALVDRVETPVWAIKQRLQAQYQQPVIEHTQIWAVENSVFGVLSLVQEQHHPITPQELADLWREQIGTIADAEKVTFESTINEISEDINLTLTLNHGNQTDLKAATEAVMEALASYSGVYDLRSSLTATRTEIEVDLKPHAESLGIGLSDIANQLRQGFYGEEVQRIPRGREDVKVMVRYSSDERSRIDQLENMRIRTSDQREIPLQAVASIRFVPGYSSIERTDRRHSINITAEVEDGVADPAEIVASLLQHNLPNWRQDYPGMTLKVDGDMSEEQKFMDSLGRDFALALLAIYAMMAVAFRSYGQPLLILTAIPFGFMGAVIGHLIMGREVSMMSILGFSACAGVVVNDNLVLLDRINQLRNKGLSAANAALQAGRDRFRAIILTSLTTFIGLTPIMAETSVQARFLIPMVISLSFGVLFATTVTLILVPALYTSAMEWAEKNNKQRADNNKTNQQYDC